MGVLNDLNHVVGFWYVRRSDIIYVLDNNFAQTGRVGFELGKEWTKVDFTPGTMEFSEEKNEGGNEGVSYYQLFSGLLAAGKVDYPAELNLMCDEPVVCRLELSNGLTLVIGNTTIPVRMKYVMQTKDNEIAISFKRKSVYKAMKAGTDIYLPPPVPVAVAVSGITANGFTVGWNKTETAIGYLLDVSLSNTFSSFVTGYQEKNVGDVSSFAVTGLSANTPYYYRVRAYNEHTQSNYSNVVMGTTATA